MIRDSYQTQKMKSNKCFSCNRIDHKFLHCPFLFAIPNKATVLYKYNFSQLILDRFKFERRTRSNLKKYHSIAHLKLVQDLAFRIKIQLLNQFGLQLENLEEEMKGLTSKDKSLLLPGLTFAEDQAILLRSVKEENET